MSLRVSLTLDPERGTATILEEAAPAHSKQDMIVLKEPTMT